LTEWGFDPSHFVYIPNFVRTEELPAGAGEAEGFVYFGRLVPEKGIATLIRAATRAGVKLQIVGAGPDEQMLRELAASSGGDITFTGHLDGSKLRETIASARAVVVPSEWYENAPISVMEASAIAKPVIGARIGGIPELIQENHTGFLFESGNVESLTDALLRVQGMPLSQLGEMGRAGRAWMRTEFSPTYYRERMLSLYRSLGAEA
jgi:glycosyltransferase involved in cell wall biosynthesis